MADAPTLAMQLVTVDMLTKRLGPYATTASVATAAQSIQAAVAKQQSTTDAQQQTISAQGAQIKALQAQVAALPKGSTGTTSASPLTLSGGYYVPASPGTGTASVTQSGGYYLPTSK